MSRVELKKPSVCTAGPLTNTSVKGSLSVIHGIIMSCYGPLGRMKQIHNGTGGCVLTTSQSSALFSGFSVSHPVIKLLIASIRNHISSFSDCGLFAANLCCYLVSHFLNLNISRPIIIKLSRILLNLCIGYLRSDECACKMKIEFNSSKPLFCLTKSVISSKPACMLTIQEADYISTLILKAFLFTVPNTLEPSSILGKTVIVPVEGQNVMESSVLPGLLLDMPEFFWSRSVPSEGLPSVEIKLALFSISLSGDFSETGEGTVHILNGVDTEGVMLDQLLILGEKLVEDNVNLLVCQKVVHPTLKQYLKRQNVFTVDRLGVALVEPLSLMTVMPNCLVRGCPHKSGQKHIHPDVVLHPFPNDINRIKIWLQQTGDRYNDMDAIAERILRGTKSGNFRMCSTHFTPDMYMMKGSLRVLKLNAVPTIFPFTYVNSSSLHQIHAQPPAKRKRVEDPLSFTSAMSEQTQISTSQATTSQIPSSSYSKVVRIIGRLAHKETQYNSKLFSRNVSVNTNRRMFSSNVATDTEDICKKVDKETQTVENPIEEEIEKVRKDHSYPKHLSKLNKLRVAEPEVSPVLPDTTLPADIVNDSASFLHEPLDISKQTVEGSSYNPERPSSSTSNNEDEDSVFEPKDPVLDDKYIVFDECLIKLLFKIRCQHKVDPPCNKPITTIKKSTEGGMLAVELKCLDGHQALKWTSCPKPSRIAVVNILIAASTLLSGSSFKKVNEMFKLLGLSSISENMFYEYEQAYLFPSIDYHWQKEKAYVMSEIQEKPLVLAGDGQFHSLGFSAKYCIYSMLNIMSNKIITYQIQQMEKGTSSIGMEKSAFKKCLQNLLSKNVEIHVVATDRQTAIRELMSTEFPEIKHEFDVWHLAKSLSERLLAASKKSKCGDIVNWISTITNHLWWCAQSCNRDIDVLLDKWKSVLFHIANKHTFRSLKNYTRCNHKMLSHYFYMNTPWIKPSDKAHQELYNIIYDSALLKDLARVSFFCHTSGLEVFRSKVLKYRSKKTSCEIDGMHARTQLAILSHNRSVNREQSFVKLSTRLSSRLGKKRPRITFPKQKRGFATQSNYDPIVERHLLDIMQDALKIMSGELQHTLRSHSSTVPRNIASIERPSKSEVITKRFSSFGHEHVG